MTPVFLLILAILGQSMTDVARQPNYVCVRLTPGQGAEVTEIRESATWWVELDDTLLLRMDARGWGPVPENLDWRILDVSVDDARLGFAPVGVLSHAALRGIRILARGGRWAVIQWPSSSVGSSEDIPIGERLTPKKRASVFPFQPDTVLERRVSRPVPTKIRDPEIQTLLDEVDADRWFADVETLASWDRFTYGTEIAEARDYLVGELEALEGVTVETSEFNVGETPAFNVIGTLEGTRFPDDWIIIGAHYDARSEMAFVLPAPGAEDNASGTAGVLEMARVFSRHPPEVTLKFICFSGEEQGLWGSEHHVAQLFASEDAAKVRSVLTMDMIGFTADADLDCLLETNAASADLVDVFAQAAADYTDLRIVISYFPFGSDHVPYLNAGLPALLVIENDWDIYPYYHTSADTPDHLSLPMGREILEMNVAAVAGLVEDILENPTLTYFLPHIPPNDAWQVSAGISNLSLDQTASIVQTTVELDQGVVNRAIQTRFLLDSGASRTLTLPGDLQRWSCLLSTTELAGTLVYSFDRGRGRELAALPLLRTSDLSQRLVFPHVPADRHQFWSGASFFNPHDAAVTYRFHLYQEGMNDLDHLLNPTFAGDLLLGPREKRVVIFQTGDDLPTLFDDSVSGSKVSFVIVETDDLSIGGFELYGKSAAGGSTGELASIACRPTPTNGPRAVAINLDGVDYRGFSLLNPTDESHSIQLSVVDWRGAQLFQSDPLTLSSGQKMLGLHDATGFAFPYQGSGSSVMETTDAHAVIFDPVPPSLFDLSGEPGRVLDGMQGLAFGNTASWGGFGFVPTQRTTLHLINSAQSDQTLEMRLIDDWGVELDVLFVDLPRYGGDVIDLSTYAGHIGSIHVIGESLFSGYLALTHRDASDALILLTPVLGDSEPGGQVTSGIADKR